MKVGKKELLDGLLEAGHVDEELYGIMMHLPYSLWSNQEYYEAVLGLIRSRQLVREQICKISTLNVMLTILDYDEVSHYVEHFGTIYEKIRELRGEGLSRYELDDIIREGHRLRRPKPSDIL